MSKVICQVLCSELKWGCTANWLEDDERRPPVCFKPHLSTILMTRIWFCYGPRLVDPIDLKIKFKTEMNSYNIRTLSFPTKRPIALLTGDGGTA